MYAPLVWPTEDFALSSYRCVVCGFALAMCVLLLGAAIYGGRGERDEEGTPDCFGQTVTVGQITADYRTTWAPSHILPSAANHNDGNGSVVYAVACWIFLLLWLFMTAVFLVIAGATITIEVYREVALQDATLCVCAALAICTFWIFVFRVGSLTAAEKERMIAMERQRRTYTRSAAEPKGVYDIDDGAKKTYFEVATAMLVVAWLLVVVATAQVQAWTLPGEQHGMLLFVAPGYGLLAGWLLYAASINFGVAYCARSYPESVKSPPEDADGYAYPASLWPIAVAVVLLACAAAVPDPTQPVPFVVALSLFTPRYRQNMIAVAIAVVGVGLGVWRVWTLRAA